MIDIKLKPCPFCGDTPSVDDPDFVYPQNHEKTLWAAHCCRDGTGCGASVLGWTRDDAINIWNTRVDQTDK